MNLFYASDISRQTDTYVFDKDESRHIVKVLRKRVGDILYLTNGKGLLFASEITDDAVKKTRVKILNVVEVPKRKYSIHIAIAPTKSNDRIEWFLEKATEMGVDEITLLLTRYSERKKVNLDRYEKILVSAMKQSLQLHKPKLNPLVKLDDFVTTFFPNFEKRIAYCKADKSLKNSISPFDDVMLLIGPEGGFSEAEIDLALQNDFLPVSLSNNRLRTETAGIMSLAAIHFVNQ